MGNAKKSLLIDLAVFGPLAALPCFLAAGIIWRDSLPLEGAAGASYVAAGLLTIVAVFFDISYIIVKLSRKTDIGDAGLVARGCVILFINWIAVPYFYIKYIRGRE